MDKFDDCEVCEGSGRTRRRFLIFGNATCASCDGSGVVRRHTMAKEKGSQRSNPEAQLIPEHGTSLRPPSGQSLDSSLGESLRASSIAAATAREERSRQEQAGREVTLAELAQAISAEVARALHAELPKLRGRLMRIMTRERLTEMAQTGERQLILFRKDTQFVKINNADELLAKLSDLEIGPKHIKMLLPGLPFQFPVVTNRSVREDNGFESWVNESVIGPAHSKMLQHHDRLQIAQQCLSLAASELVRLFDDLRRDVEAMGMTLLVSDVCIGFREAASMTGSRTVYDCEFQIRVKW